MVLEVEALEAVRKQSDDFFEMSVLFLIPAT